LKVQDFIATDHEGNVSLKRKNDVTRRIENLSPIAVQSKPYSSINGSIGKRF
jgi:hypothetical protein